MSRAVQTEPKEALDYAAIRDFFQIGFAVLRGVFSADEIALMRDGFERLESRARGLVEPGELGGSSFVVQRERSGAGARVRLHRVVWCGAAEPVLGHFGRDARLVTPAARLLGSTRVVHLINQAHFKLPGDGVEFPWHQDSSRRRFGRGEWMDVNGRGSYVQTVTAIDECGDQNGGLRFIPGSCSFGHIELPEDSRGSLPDWRVDGERAVTPSLAPGDVVLFGPYTFHGSPVNTSDRPRRVLINGYAYPGANRRVYPGAGLGVTLHTERRR